MKLGYLIGTYPLVTTTFIEREVQGLRERGMDITILSIRRPPREVERIPEYRIMQAGIQYLLPVNWGQFVLAHLYWFFKQPRPYARLLGYLVSRPRQNLRQRVMTALHFGEGVYAAYVLRDQACDHLHAHFADRAATVALCVSRLLGKPYSLTAHANDLYASPVLLDEKFKQARFAITVSRFNKDHLLRNYPDLEARRIVVLHPWVDLNEFRPPAAHPQSQQLSVLSVGRLVEKKGHRYLVEACRLLREQGVDVKCRIVGAGPLERELRTLIQEQGLEDVVSLEGSLPKDTVRARLAEADVFVLASVIASDGDRDGMPVALAEAMAMSVPVVSTDIVGIGELVRPGAGYLVPPKDPVALAGAIRSIYDKSPAARDEMGRRGRVIVEADFDVSKGTDVLAELFRQSSSPGTHNLGHETESEMLELQAIEAPAQQLGKNGQNGR